MNLRASLLAASTALWAIGVAGCAGTPSPGEKAGEPSSPRIDRADGNGESCHNKGDRGQTEQYLALARKLWDRDVIESLRYLRKGAQLRDADCCRQYLAHAEAQEVNWSQRLYARLYVEGLLRNGPVLTPTGEDARGELYSQLCWAWRYTKPCALAKVRQVLLAMSESGVRPGKAQSAFIAQMIKETGLPADTGSREASDRQDVQMYAGETADEAKRWLWVPPLDERRDTRDWVVGEGNAWGGGSDRLVIATNVLVFLVNAEGEPCYRGNRLWISNLGESPVYFTSLDVGSSNRELLPGREEVLPVTALGAAKGEFTTGIPVSVKFHRPLR